MYYHSGGIIRGLQCTCESNLALINFLQESFTTLLTDEEMQELIENFDKLDVNQGT